MILPEISLADLILLGQLPDMPAIIDAHRQISYPELSTEIERCADGLYAKGIRERDVVGIELPNGIDFAVVFLATLKLGAVVTPIRFGATKEERRAQIEASKAKLLVDSASLPDFTANVPPVRRKPVDISAEQLACLPFSSGTTGTPKGVQLTHRNLVANVIQFASAVPLTRHEVCLSVLPFSHIYGLTATLAVPLFLRTTIIAKQFDKTTFIEDHEKYRVNVSFIVPPLANLLAKDPLVDATDFTALHTVISGAAPLNVNIGKQVAERLQARVIQGYGLSEASPVTHLARLASTPIESIGHALPGTSTKVVDPETGEITEFGELWLSGPQIMSGYLGSTEGFEVDAHGSRWFRTGDLVRRNPDGTLVVTDRLKDVIKSHGFQVSPVQLEEIVLKHPHVVDAAAFRGWGPNGEEQPEVAVVTNGDISDLQTFVRDQVSNFAQIRRVHILEHIPRSPSGKILRSQLTNELGKQHYS